MKKLLLVFLLAFAVFLYLRHQRLFLRDPLATLTIDGAPIPAQIYINYTNDVLILRPDAQPLIIQNLDHTPGNTKVLPCLRWTACLTESDQAPKFPLAIQPTQVTMTNREITYRDEQNKPTRITLR